VVRLGVRHREQYVTGARCRCWDHRTLSRTRRPPTGVKLMMLHDVRNEDGIKSFFTEVHEYYIRVRRPQGGHVARVCGAADSCVRLNGTAQYLMNPFYDPDTPIESKAFDSKVRVLAKKYLT
jgi:trafficking protein particle complex subunit 2